MSKPVKTLLRNELIRRLEGADSLVVLSLAGVGGEATNQLRRSLREKNIRVTVVKNAIAKQAFEQVGLSGVSSLLDGPCAVAVSGPDGPVPLVRELLEKRKDIPALLVRGALMEGETFGPDRVVELSKYPTREEALGQLSQLASSPGAKLVGAILGAGGRVAGAVKTLADRSEDEPDPNG